MFVYVVFRHRDSLNTEKLAWCKQPNPYSFNNIISTNQHQFSADHPKPSNQLKLRSTQIGLINMVTVPSIV